MVEKNLNLQFLSTDTIEEMHVEITNICNAACPMCGRNNGGAGLSPNPGWGSWHDGDELLVFNKCLPKLKKVFFCGTHGDPIAHPKFLDIVKHCKSLGMHVEIFTNGSLKSINWWKEFANVLGTSDKVVFGIDGIETNHLYRQNTQIEKVLKHLQICANGNPITQWDFLAFKHNEHEINLCQKLAKEYGVDKFRIRKTARFGRGNQFPVLNNSGEITHYLEPPVNEELQHPNIKVIQQIFKKLPDAYKINCLYQEAKKIYVNSRLEVFPCCYISDENERLFLNNNAETVQVPIDHMNLRNSSWNSILNLEFYKEQLVKSFTNNNTLKRCIATCGIIAREQNQNQQVII